MIMHLIKQYESETNNRFLIGNTEHHYVKQLIRTFNQSA